MAEIIEEPSSLVWAIRFIGLWILGAVFALMTFVMIYWLATPAKPGDPDRPHIIAFALAFTQSIIFMWIVIYQLMKNDSPLSWRIFLAMSAAFCGIYGLIRSLRRNFGRWYAHQKAKGIEL